MEIKQAGQHVPELLAKLERAKLEMIRTQSFIQVAQEAGEAVKIKKLTDSTAAVNLAEIPVTREITDEIVSNYWQPLRLAMHEDHEQDEGEPKKRRKPEKKPKKRRT